MARAPWVIITIVSCLPVLVLAIGTALAHMLRADAEAMDTPGSRTDSRKLRLRRSLHIVHRSAT